MTCPQIPILGACVAGAIAGTVFYFAAARRHKTYSGFILLEAMTQGSLLAGAAHLMFCVLCPEQLVELFDPKNGAPIVAGAVEVKIENLHATEIFIASFMLAITSIRVLWTIWQKPGH